MSGTVKYSKPVSKTCHFCSNSSKLVVFQNDKWVYFFSSATLRYIFACQAWIGAVKVQSTAGLIGLFGSLLKTGLSCTPGCTHCVLSCIWYTKCVFFDTQAVKGRLYRWPIQLWSGRLAYITVVLRALSSFLRVSTQNIIKVCFWTSALWNHRFYEHSRGHEFGMRIWTPLKSAFC